MLVLDIGANLGLFSLQADELVEPAVERVRQILSMLPGTVDCGVSLAGTSAVVRPRSLRPETAR